MIHQYKVDDRLIHGMVYMTWFPKYNINRAIIVDDNIVNNETRKMSLRLGMPQSAKLVIWDFFQPLMPSNSSSISCRKVTRNARK